MCRYFIYVGYTFILPILKTFQYFHEFYTGTYRLLATSRSTSFTISFLLGVLQNIVPDPKFIFKVIISQKQTIY